MLAALKIPSNYGTFRSSFTWVDIASLWNVSFAASNSSHSNQFLGILSSVLLLFSLGPLYFGGKRLKRSQNSKTILQIKCLGASEVKSK